MQAAGETALPEVPASSRNELAPVAEGGNERRRQHKSTHRSQRKSCNWEKFKRMLEYFGVPKPKVTEKRRLHQVALR